MPSYSLNFSRQYFALMREGKWRILQWMRQITSIKSMQRMARIWQREGRKIGLVPTMGYLHEGHMSLVHVARKKVGAEGRVVVSIYVNPLQFGPQEDFSHYPRDLARDTRLCRAAGVDVIFVPPTADMYVSGAEEAKAHSTYVIEETLARRMEGVTRPTHFRGVTTVVAKLFLAVLPEVAVFGAKDFQQAAILQRMTRDLNFPVRLVVAPTKREPDGLALSSRNKYLSAEERVQAVALWQALQRARQTVRTAKAPRLAQELKAELSQFIQIRPAARVDYIEFFEPDTLAPVTEVKSGTQMALAVYVGKTRLIDNGRL